MSETIGVEVSNKQGVEAKKLSREDKLRESKIEEQLTKSIAAFTSADDKIQFLLRRCIDNEKSNKKLQQTQKQCINLTDAAKRERDLLQQEYNKAVLTKTKLESLCRELQKQNKAIKDDSLSKIREEEERRKETQAKFQKSLNEIQTLMNDNNEKNMKLKQDNQEMTDKFKYILEQYELREQQMEKINKQLELVQQLSDAKVAKAQMEAQAERAQLQAEKEFLETELLKAKKESLELKSAEKFLKEQIDIYSEKYSEFQDSLKKSHNVFTGYKGDMEKMSKKILKLEKETATWRQKAEKANSVALDLASEKHIRDQHIAKVTKQIWQLQKLCRTLQAERTVLIATLKENNIEIPPMPEAPPAEKEPELPEIIENKGPDKLDLMTKSCAELKQNLAALQGQLNDYSLDGEAPKKPSNNKKGKRNKKHDKSSEPEKVEVEKNGSEKTEIEQSKIEGNEPEKVESENVEPEKVETENVEPEKVKLETIEPVNSEPEKTEPEINEEVKTSEEKPSNPEPEAQAQ